MMHDGLPTNKTQQLPDDIRSTGTYPKLPRAESSTQPPRVIGLSSASESSPDQRRLEDFARLSCDWFWEMDANLRYCYLSDRFTEITGIPESLVLGMTDDEIGIIEHDASAWREHLTDLQDHRSFRNFSYSQVHPDGRTVVVSLDGDALFDRSGIFLGYRGIATEISDQTTAEAAVQFTRDLYQLAGHVYKLGYWEWDEVADRCIYCSDEMASLLGVSVDEYLRISTSNETDLQWIHADDHERYKRATQKFRDDHSGFKIDYRMLCADGRIADVCEVVAPIFDSNGTLIRTIGFVRDISESKQAEAALQKVTALYAQTEALAKIGHFEWNEVDDRSSYCSAELARLLGVSVEEYLKRNISAAADLKWTHPDDRDRYAMAIRKYDSQPITTQIEYRLISDSGKVRQVRELLSPEFDQDGSLVRSIGYVQDISESKNAEALLVRARDELEQRVQDRTAELQKANEELVASEQRLREAASITRLGYFKWDAAATRGIFCDDEMADILGVPIADCMAESMGAYLARVHPEDLDMVQEIYKDSNANGKSIHLEYRIIRPGGEIRHVHEASNPSVNEDGSLNHWFGTLQDITDREVLSEELAETEARFHQLVLNSREVFWIGTADWRRVIYVSPAYEQVWGRTCQSLLDDPAGWIETVHPDDREFVIAEIQDRITDRDSNAEFSEYRIIRPDGTVRWLSVRAYPIRDNAGKIIRVAGFGEDITERKAAADALHHAQKMDAVGQLTGGVAHDFNNLLAVILGNSGLLQGRLPPEDEMLVREIIQAASRGNELTRRLLAFSRQQPLRPTATDINALINNLGELLRRTLGTTIEIDAALAPSDTRVMVDPTLLENAILNLALNARDAMPEGGTLRVRTTEEKVCTSSAPIPQACDLVYQMSIVVEDNGAGMTPDVLSHALEPFFTTKEIGQGSGLGLPMVYGFAKQSKGDLAIESEYGKGTKVTLSLPCMHELDFE